MRSARRGMRRKTIIGDAVNVASRLESETKALKVELLVSEELLKAAGVVVPRDEIRLFQLRGVSEQIPAHACHPCVHT